MSILRAVETACRIGLRSISEVVLYKLVRYGIHPVLRIENSIEDSGSEAICESKFLSDYCFVHFKFFNKMLRDVYEGGRPRIGAFLKNFLMATPTPQIKCGTRYLTSIRMQVILKAFGSYHVGGGRLGLLATNPSVASIEFNYFKA